MSAATAVSSCPLPVSSEQISRFTFHVSRARANAAVELPAVVPASRLAEKPAPAMVRTGIEALDAVTGGLPRGGLSEICGPASSGRTSVALTLMAAMSRCGESCALVDASDSFDPKSAEAAGVELRRLLWVRCSQNRVIGRSGDRAIKNISDCRLSIADCERNQKSQISHRKSQMDSLEQALKATDLLLQGGGFGLVVVDLGDVPAQVARRVPLTSWFRFRRAVENTPTVLVVIEQEPYAKTCASVVLKLSARSCQLAAGLQDSGFRLPGQQQPAHTRIFSGLDISAEVVRSATQQKKPVQSAGARWESRTAWAG